MPNPVTGHQTWIGAKKETTFGVAATPVTIFPGTAAFTSTAANAEVPRDNGKMRYGQSLSPASQFTDSIAMSPTPDPDTLFPFLAWAFGAQSATSGAVYATTALTGPVVAGAGATLPVTAGTGTRFTNGDSIQVGFGTANVETVTITGVSANSLTATTTKNHASADLVQGLSATAFQSVLSYGATLPSFTIEEYRYADALDHLGCTVDSLKLTGNPGSLLKVDLGIKAASLQINASPATPSFSNVMPFHIDTATPTQVLYKGVALPAGTILKGWDVALANSLETTYIGVGSRYAAAFPVGQRKGAVNAKLSWVTNALYQDFLGAVGATSPQSTIAGLQLAIPVASPSYADATRLVPYQLIVNLPNIYPKGNVVANKQYGSLEQAFSGSANETVAGMNNDLSLTIVGTVASAY
jgi:hypothetical protein